MNRILITILTSFIFFLIPQIGQAQNTIRFGVTNFYPPFVFSSKSGYIHGFDIDVAKALCQQLNAQCSFTAMSLTDAFNSLKQNKVDLIMGAISITPKRKGLFNFSRPYLKSTMSYVTLSTSQFEPQQIQGKRIGVVKDSTFYAYLVSTYPGTIKVMPYDTNEQLATALSNKEIDAMLIDTPAANFWIGYSTGLFKMVGTPAFLPFDEGYGIAANKNNTSLIPSVDGALNTLIKNGSFEKIKQNYKIYFSNQPPIQQPRA